MLKLRPPESKKAESGVADTLRILLLSSALLNDPSEAGEIIKTNIKASGNGPKGKQRNFHSRKPIEIW